MQVELSMITKAACPLFDVAQIYHNGQLLGINARSLNIYSSGPGRYELFQKIKHTRAEILEIMSDEGLTQRLILMIIRTRLPQPIAEEITPEISRVDEMISAIIS